MSKILIRLVSLYLWWFVIVFIFALLQSSSFLAPGTFLGDFLIRQPYQWDFELMFTTLFFIWGIFLWKASTKINENRTLIIFSAWAFLTHGVVFIIIGLIQSNILVHAITDSLGWLAASTLLFRSLK